MLFGSFVKTEDAATCSASGIFKENSKINNTLWTVIECTSMKSCTESQVYKKFFYCERGGGGGVDSKQNPDNSSRLWHDKITFSNVRN